MSDHDKWRKRASTDKEGEFIDENNFISESKDANYRRTYLKRECELLKSRATEFGLSFNNFYFEELEDKFMNGKHEKTSTVYIDFVNKSNNVRNIQIESIYNSETKKLWFYINRPSEFVIEFFDEELIKFKNFMDYFIDYICGKNEFRLLLTTGNIKKNINVVIKNINNYKTKEQ